jgi:LacI family transcriptional regulator
VGFDNFPESAYFWPTLSTVRQPWPEKCAIAVRALIRMIEERREYESFTLPETKVLLPELIIRKSSVRVQ